MLDIDHGIVIFHRRDQEALGVVGRGGHHDLEPRDVRERAVMALGVLGTVAPAAPHDGADHQRDWMSAVEHGAPLGRVIHDLVHGQHGEVDALVDEDRPQAAEGGTDADTGDGALGERDVEGAVGSEFVRQPHRGAENALDVRNAYSQHEDARVFSHHLDRRSAHGFPKLHSRPASRRAQARAPVGRGQGRPRSRA